MLRLIKPMHTELYIYYVCIDSKQTESAPLGTDVLFISLSVSNIVFILLRERWFSSRETNRNIL